MTNELKPCRLGKVIRIYFTLQNGKGCEMEGPEFLVLKLLNNFRYRRTKGDE